MWRRRVGDHSLGMHGVVNDAIAIYFVDASLAAAFVARWCIGNKVEIVGGVYQLRQGQTTPRIGVTAHRTPRAVGGHDPPFSPRPQHQKTVRIADVRV